jgi:hypothetical protein
MLVIFGRDILTLYCGNEINNPTKIVSSPDIGPITTSNPSSIYKSRPLSTMIKSAKLIRSLNSQSIIPEFGKNFIYSADIRGQLIFIINILCNFFLKGKRKFDNNPIEDKNEGNKIFPTPNFPKRIINLTKFLKNTMLFR